MRLSTSAAIAGVALSVSLIAQAASSPRKASPPPTAPKSPAIEKGAAGRQVLYGTVVMANGTRYTGPLRWGDEEAYWDDLFDGSKEERPYSDRQPEKDRPK